ncbi:MAG: GNAT family N-acetyltransferase [Nitriliruptoraceae bacterium]
MRALQFVPVNSAEEAVSIADWLRTSQRDDGLPLVDESEHLRLESLAGGRTPADWEPHAVWSDGQVLAYAGLRTEEQDDGRVVELAVTRRAVDAEEFRDLLQAVAGIAPDANIWIRGVRRGEHRACDDAGFDISRELAIYRCQLAEVGPSVDVTTTDASVRRMEPADVETVAGVLAAAYTGTAEAGWSADLVASRMALPWFRLDDVLLAVANDGVTVDGLHWMKRRDATTAEVYNLAVHPRAHGRGLGRFLLEAGKRHMREAGHARMILWVDADNEPAVRLYQSAGFLPYSLDVMLSPSRSRWPGGTSL